MSDRCLGWAADETASRIAAEAFNHMPCREWGSLTQDEVHGAIQLAAYNAIARLTAALETAVRSRDGYAKDAAARADECDRWKALAAAAKATNPTA